MQDNLKIYNKKDNHRNQVEKRAHITYFFGTALSLTFGLAPTYSENNKSHVMTQIIVLYRSAIYLLGVIEQSSL